MTTMIFRAAVSLACWAVWLALVSWAALVVAYAVVRVWIGYPLPESRDYNEER
jgi:fatty acid desaturase